MAFIGNEGWKSDLNPAALRKLEELEERTEKLLAERKQRQLMVETLEQSLERQKKKTEEEKSNASQLQREIQVLQESNGELQKKNEKFCHDLAAKENQNTCLQGQLDAKARQLDSVNLELKKAEKSVEQYENNYVPMSAPNFATPQKRESFRPNRSGFGACGDAEDDLRKRLEDAERKLDQKDQEIKDLEVKLFEKSAMFSHASSFDEQPVGGGGSNLGGGFFAPSTPGVRDMGRSSVLDETRAVAARQTPGPSSSFDIANRAKSSSIMFDYQASPPIKKPPVNFNAPQDRKPPTVSDFHPLNSDKSKSDIESLDKAKREALELSNKCSTLENAIAAKDRELNVLKNQSGTSHAPRLQLNYDQANARVAELEQKLKDVQSEFDCQRHNAESTKQSLEKKLKELDRDLKKEVQQAQEEASKAKVDLQKTEETLRQSENGRRDEIGKAEAEKSQMQKELLNLKETSKTELEKLRCSLENLRSVTVEQDAKISAASKEKQQHEVEEVKLQRACDDAKAQVDKLEDRMKAMRNEESTRVNGMMTDWKEKERKMNEELNKERDRIDHLNSELAQLAVLEKLNSDLQAKITALGLQLDNVRNASEKELKERQRELDSTVIREKESEEKTRALTEQLTEIAAAKELLEKELSEKKVAIEELQASPVEGLKEENGTLRANFAALLAEKESLEKDVSEAASSHEVKVQQACEDAVAQIGQLEEKLKNLENERSTQVDGMISEWKEKECTLNEELCKERDRIDHLNSDLAQQAELKNMNTDLHAQIETLGLQLVNVRSSCDEELQDNGKEYEEKMRVLTEQLTEISAAKELVEKELSEKTLTIEELQAFSIDSLKEENEKLRANYTALLAEKTSLENSAASLQERIATLQEEKAQIDLEEEINAARQREEMESARQHFVSKNSMLESEVAASKMSLDLAKGQLNEEKANTCHLRQNNKELQSKLQALEFEWNSEKFRELMSKVEDVDNAQMDEDKKELLLQEVRSLTQEIQQRQKNEAVLSDKILEADKFALSLREDLKEAKETSTAREEERLVLLARVSHLEELLNCANHEAIIMKARGVDSEVERDQIIDELRKLTARLAEAETAKKSAEEGLELSVMRQAEAEQAKKKLCHDLALESSSKIQKQAIIESLQEQLSDVKYSLIMSMVRGEDYECLKGTNQNLLETITEVERQLKEKSAEIAILLAQSEEDKSALHVLTTRQKEQGEGAKESLDAQAAKFSEQLDFTRKEAASRIEAITAMLDSKNKEVEELLEQHSLANVELDKARSDIGKMNEKLTETNNTLEMIQGESDQVEQIRLELESVKAEKSRLSADLEIAHSNVDELTKRKEMLEQERAAEKEEQVQNEAQLEERFDVLRGLEVELVGLKERNDMLNVALTKAEEVAADSNKRLEEKEKEFELLDEAKREKMHLLEEKVEGTKKEKEALEITLANATSSVSKIKLELEEKSRTTNELDAMLSALKAAMEEMEESRETWMRKEADLMEVKEKLEKSLGERTDSESAWKNKVQDLQNKAASSAEEVNATIKKLEDRQSQLDSELETRSEEAEARLVESLRRGKEAHEEETRELMQKIEAKSLEMLSLESKISELNSKVEEQSLKLDEVVAEKAGVLEKFYSAEKEKADLSKKKESFDARTQMLLTNLKRKENELTTSIKENHELLQENSNLKKLASENESLKLRLEELKEQISGLEKNNDAEEQMPWDVDEELKELNPEELLDVLADDLTSKQQAQLHALVVKHLQEERSKNSEKMLDLIHERDTSKKEIERLKLRLQCASQTAAPHSSSTSASATTEHQSSGGTRGGGRLTRSKVQASDTATSTGLSRDNSKEREEDKKSSSKEDASKKRFLSPDKPASSSGDKRTRVLSPKVADSDSKVVPLGTRNRGKSSAMSSTVTTQVKSTNSKAVIAGLAKDAPENPFKSKTAAAPQKQQRPEKLPAPSKASEPISEETDSKKRAPTRKSNNRSIR